MSARTVAVNTINQLVGKTISACTTLCITLLLARFAGANGYGDITKITTFVAIFYLFADFGLNAAYLQKDASNTSIDSPWWQTLLTIRVLGGIVLAFVAISILAFLPSSGSDGYTPAVKLGIILYSTTILFQAIITTANAVFQKQLRYSRATIALFAGSIVSLLLIFISTKLFLPNALVFAGICSMAIGLLVPAIVGLIFVRKTQRLTFLWNSSRVRMLMTAALPLGLTLLFDVIYFRADNIILTLTRSTTEVGLYGFAYKLFEFPLVIPTFFMNAVYPLMLISTQTNPGNILGLCKKSILVLLPMSLGIIAAGWFLAPLVTLVKPEFEGSILALRILLLGLPFFFLTAVTMWTLVALKKQWALIWIYGFSMIVNICANLVLIPTHGFIAAAWVTVVSEGIVLFLSTLTLLRVISL